MYHLYRRNEGLNYCYNIMDFSEREIFIGTSKQKDVFCSISKLNPCPWSFGITTESRTFVCPSVLVLSEKKLEGRSDRRRFTGGR